MEQRFRHTQHRKKLKEYFDEVCFIDYRRPDTYGIGLLNTFTKGNVLRILPTLIYVCILDQDDYLADGTLHIFIV